MTETRTQIARYVESRPGVHFNDLVRRSGLAPGQVQYHLRELLGKEQLTSEQLYGKTHYYPPEYDEWERSALALLRRETARDVLITLLERETAQPATLADDLGIARSTLEWHVNHLVEQNLVEKRRDARNRVTLVSARPEETGKLLATVTPSFPERMVDRFTRLVDDLLAE
ncbi:winged helix-turn-helix transcriptional regulator [Haladaptatus pallidirubidus]|uniref:HVO-0163 N-terminal HTH domain-containing protein n=1 Tax=Haladaptatus pallidirubidus TaxID=1008152 RepID=A0AAV3UL88_9EURY|nr:winged helix-turn-helix transcriptional regulator [Haladaptatus pallidirubidus]